MTAAEWEAIVVPPSCGLSPGLFKIVEFDFYRVPNIVLNTLAGHRAGMKGLRYVNTVDSYPNIVAGALNIVPGFDKHLCRGPPGIDSYNRNRACNGRAMVPGGPANGFPNTPYCGARYLGFMDATNIGAVGTVPPAGLLQPRTYPNGDPRTYFFSCDEYPFAATIQGGGQNDIRVGGSPNTNAKKVVARCVHEKENSSQGGCTNAGYRAGIMHFDSFWISLVNVPAGIVDKTETIPDFCLSDDPITMKGPIQDNAQLNAWKNGARKYIVGLGPGKIYCQ